MKLGEILIKMGLITEAQLELALQTQLIFGGHLGTSLIETGLLDEDTLGGVLASSAGVPYASHDLLTNIAKTAIDAVPRKIAEEYRVVPIKLEGTSIHLAFVNPRDLRALDALKFATGRNVVAWIAPEVRVYQALERYYGVVRRARYIKLEHRLDELHVVSPIRDEAVPIPSTDEVPFLSSSEADAAFGYGRPWQEVANELFGLDSAEPQPPASVMSLPELADRYCRAESRDDLARAVLDFTEGRADRMLLMRVRANRASVWEQRGFGRSDGARCDAAFEVISEPVFRLLMGNDYYYGALPKDEESLSIYARLGMDAPEEVLLIPVHFNDHLVALALADGGRKGGIKGDVEDFLRAFRLFSTAVLLVALRKDLRDAARPVARAAEVSRERLGEPLVDLPDDSRERRAQRLR